MSDLSPAAQAVLDNYGRALFTKQYAESGRIEIAIAAALRAAADQAAPEKQLEDIAYIHESYIDGMRDALACIEIIANELEAQ